MAKVRKLKHPDEHYLGKEPSPRVYSSSNDPELGKALNWYAYFLNPGEGVEHLYEWTEKNIGTPQAEALRKVKPRCLSSTLVGLARMALTGSVLPPDTVSRLRKNVLLAAGKNDPEEDPEEETPPEEEVADGGGDEGQERPRPVPTSKQKALERDFLAEVAENIDSFEYSGGKAKFSTYAMLAGRSAPAKWAELQRLRFVESKPYYEEILAGTCPQLEEGYSHWSKAFRREMVQLMQTGIDDCDRYLGNKQAVRKPRAKKQVKLSEIVKHLRYMKECNEHRLVSVEPMQVPGAKELWLYNHKYSTLTVLRAGAGGLVVKGTTIYDFVKEKSQVKKLRKPEEVLPRVLSAHMRDLNKVMDELRTTSYTPNGRVNEETVLLRVIK